MFCGLSELYLSNLSLKERDSGPICELEFLEVLDISYNKFNTLYSFIFLKNLKHLDIGNNQINDAEYLIYYFPYIEYVDLRGNPLSKVNNSIFNKIESVLIDNTVKRTRYLEYDKKDAPSPPKKLKREL